MRALLGGFALLLLGSVANAAEPPPDGAALFRQRCGICHATGGFGANMLGRRLGPEKSVLERRQDLTPDYIRLSVRRGVGSMPPFSRVELTDRELAAISGHITRK